MSTGFFDSPTIVGAERHFVTVHPGSDLAFHAQRIDHNDTLWLEIHRLAASQDMRNGVHLYRTSCRRDFLVQQDARPLSSGFLGAKCPICWPALRAETAAA